MKKTIIITGGTKGIGAAIAQKFYTEDYFVLIGARTDNGLAKQLGERAQFVKMDVKNRQDHIAIVQAALDWTGQLDVYVNGAGLSAWQPLEKINEDFLEEMLAVNLKSVFWGCQAAAAKMQKSAVIINISSLAGKRGSLNNAAYCAAKFGVNGVTQALAKELGSKGIRVHAVCPVYVKTPGVLEALKHAHSPAQGKDIAQYLENFIQSQSALQRLPTGEDVANVCFFLASQGSAAVTGQCINVDCGVLPQ